MALAPFAGKYVDISFIVKMCIQTTDIPSTLEFYALILGDVLPFNNWMSEMLKARKQYNHFSYFSCICHTEVYLSFRCEFINIAISKVGLELINMPMLFYFLN